MKQLALSVLVPFALAACGGSSTGGSAATPAPTPTPTPPISGQMQELAASGVSGTLEVVKGTSSFTLTLKIKGLAPSSNHVNHIHKGTCPGAPGPIATDVIGALQPVVADASGTATATTTVPVAYAVPSTGWYANIHAGPDLQGPNAKSISCGNLPVS